MEGVNKRPEEKDGPNKLEKTLIKGRRSVSRSDGCG